MEQVIGVIGGSGLYEMAELQDMRTVSVSTPFGNPSDDFIVGTLEGVKMVFLPRHGKGHRLLPGEINYRANIYGMKSLGVTRLISVSAVGSMKEEIVPGNIVIPDQFIDRTNAHRRGSFFGDGVVAHVQFADPVCGELSRCLASAARAAGATVHEGGTYICMEGPAFSTRAESNLYRSFGVSVIGMTNIPEAKLAREAELCYGVIALATDYDCWHEAHEDVSVEAIVALIKKNVTMARAIIKGAATSIHGYRTCQCGDSLQHAIITDRGVIPEKVKRDLGLIIGRYLD
ncbi:S-methyl-5'-thioadenosine phosphorylase [Geobacter sp. DSM 9736]|uniref:S-methyl-5'-thioadenosine phosphorylase n=1 Tax=Geobacter sp. DSM 9736 TaxID=1277350 RepID=UPI000B50C99F|nr:S-methyl-5'-thioadenosine phosphorylase [Geobacter sp. DSM 9736]SNB44883.1 methylthioadenosine phosphorylase [Geobacter sp. DSM 9736]